MARLASSDRITAAVLRSRPVSEGCDAIARELERAARDIAYSEAYDEGEYAAKIGRIPTSQPGAKVRAAAKHSRFVEEGTGIHGPRRRPIRPRRGRFLVFKVKSGETVFARQVQGRKAVHTMRRAAEQVGSVAGRRWRPR